MQHTNYNKSLWKYYFWEELWGLKCQAIEKASIYAYIENKYSKYKQYAEYAILICSFGSALTSILSMDHLSFMDYLNVFFGSMSTVFSGVVVIAKWDSIIQETGLACKHFEFLQSEIEKYMCSQRSTLEFKQIYEVLFTFFNYFDSSARLRITDSVRERFAMAWPQPVPMLPIAHLNPRHNAEFEEEAQELPPPEQMFCIVSLWPPMQSVLALQTSYFSLDQEGFITTARDLFFHQTRSERNPFAWLSNLFREDGARVFQQWFESVYQHKVFFDKFRITAGEDTMYVVCEAVPWYNNHGEFIGMKCVCLQISRADWTSLDIAEIAEILRACDGRYSQLRSLLRMRPRTESLELIDLHS